ncbi:MAG: glycoside hydrolase family 99-like domain-containing protein [Clostridia bacterium]|nr:glycoside hydrolase family 99-like domain-containing protein [Clostridia bacterium]
MQEKNPLMLLNEIFTFGLVSSWEVDDRGGEIKCIGHACGVFLNNSNRFPIRCKRRFREQTDGKVTFEYRFKIKKAASGFSFEIGNGKNHAFRMVTKANTLCYDRGDSLVPVLTYEEGLIYPLKAVIDLDNKECKLCINGSDYGTYPLADKSGVINEFIMTSPSSEQTEIYFYYARMYKNYLVYEKFSSCAPRRLPYDWKMEGAYESEAFVEYLKGYDSGESHVLLIADGRRAPKPTVVSKSFERTGGNVVFSFKFNLSNPDQKENGIAFSLMSDSSEAVTLRAKRSGVYAGDTLLKKYNPNVWQRVRIYADLDAHTAEITVNNSRLGPIEIPSDITSVNGIQFKTHEFEWTNCEIDEILVYPRPAVAEDYPTEPVKPKTNYKIGMQTCFLWREGIGPGWDKIECHPERKPYLGWYDDSLPEKADWEIKWMAEHGISFILPCWYPPDGYNGGPLRFGTAYEDYFTARYWNHMKIALDICDLGNVSEMDFKEYLVPYWIENFFTAPNYMLVNNKPLIGFLSYDMFIRICGSAEKVCLALDFIREECKKVGFDGACIILNEQHRTPAQVRVAASCGFDAIFSYAWGRICHEEDAQIKILEAQRDMNLIKVIPTVCQGYNDLAWNGYTNGGYITPELFKRTLEWVRDDFLNSDIASGDIENMVLLDNWNEYGEGHFFMPAELYGFSYLDAVRSVFTDNKPHEDVVPTENQRARLETMYPKGRKALKQVSARPARHGKVIKGWYFDNPTDIAAWSASEGIENLRAENGALMGEIKDSSGYIYLNEPMAADCMDVCYIRIKIKLEDVEKMHYTFEYITENDNVWDKEKCVSSWVTESYVEECYAGVYAKKSWQQVVTGLRLHPAASKGRFTIESIELVEYEVKPTRVYADGEERRFFAEPIIENGVILVPFEGIRDLTEVYTSWDYENNRMLVANEELEIVFTFGSDTALVNGTPEKLGAAPVIEDRIAYLPIDFVCGKTGVKTKYIPEEKEFYFLK